MTPDPAPPTMAGWNLALRFGLELTALFGLGFAAWKLLSGPVRMAAIVIVPVIAAVLWTVFNVVGDPSRSGAAPVEVPGWTRLIVELAVLGAGAAAIVVAGRRDIGVVYAALIVFHYAVSMSRVQWLLSV